MEYNRGIFGVLNQDDMEEQPLVLLDGGVERRWGEVYDFFSDCRPGYEGFLFQYTLGGEGVFERDKSRYQVGRGKGFLIQFPEKSRYCLEDREKEPWEFLYLHFKGAAALPFIGKIRTICPDILSLDENSPPIRMALHLQKRLTNGERLQRYEGGEFLYCFLCALLRETEHPAAQKRSSSVSRAVKMMEDEYHRLAGIEEVAARLEISPEHLSRAFKEEMGTGPLSYLTGLRLQSAINDLLGTQRSIDSIARKNGFSNGNYFAKIFRKHMGISPSSYRKSSGNGKYSRKQTYQDGTGE